MIHRYKNNGYNIVLDVNSGSVHVVDELVYDIIGLLDEGKDGAFIREHLKGQYQEEADFHSPWRDSGAYRCTNAFYRRYLQGCHRTF